MPELPDLEIYFQGIEDDALRGWLGEALGGALAPEPKGAGWAAQHGDLSLRLTARALGPWHALGIDPAALTPGPRTRR